jgi:tetratricopeptide (TPR) repeat protein
MPRFRLFLPPVFGLLLLLAGCARNDDSSFTTETDDPAYQRGKSLEKQGRDQEALSAFLKIIARRDEEAPESHLEAGLLCEEHVKDPIAAIYHYRKYLELRPNSPQADLVRQRIAACMRDFARTLPGEPLGSDASDLNDIVARLQKENDELKAELAAVRGNQPAPASEPAMSSQPPAQSQPDTVVDETSQPIITRAPMNTEPPAATPERTPVARPVAAAVPVATNRVHTVSKGDTLMSISQHYYGTRSKWRDIYAANRDLMKSENDLKIGMQLKIP